MLKSVAATHPALRSLRDLLRLQSVGIENGVHEIRSLLLTGGYAKILLRERAGSLSAREQGYLAAIIENTRRIKDVLASLDRLANCHELDVTCFAAAEILRDIRETTPRERRALVRYAEGEPCSVFIVGDRQKLRDALHEVLAAAMWSGVREVSMHAQNRRVYLSIQGVVQDPSGGKSSMESHVHSGSGMLRERVEEFERSRDVVRLHGGLLSVDTGGVGSSGRRTAAVTIKLPAAATDEQEVAVNA